MSFDKEMHNYLHNLYHDNIILHKNFLIKLISKNNYDLLQVLIAPKDMKQLEIAKSVITFIDDKFELQKMAKNYNFTNFESNNSDLIKIILRMYYEDNNDIKEFTKESKILSNILFENTLIYYNKNLKLEYIKKINNITGDNINENYMNIICLTIARLEGYLFNQFQDVNFNDFSLEFHKKYTEKVKKINRY